MDIAFALRRKRDEIAATIAAYEARIDDASMDLAALDRAARLLDPEAEGGEAAIHREFGMLGKPDEASQAQCKAWELERASTDESTLPAAKQPSCDDHGAPPFKSIGVRKGGFAEWVAHATAQARQQAPEEFFYFNWP